MVQKNTYFGGLFSGLGSVSYTHLLVRESRYYFILNKRDTCRAEENPSLNVEFWENPDDMYWGVPGVLRKEKLPEVGLKSSLVSSE